MDALIKTTTNNSSTFSSIYNTFSKKMYAYGISIGFCQYLCHDAVHDVFYNLFVSNNKLDDVENLERYLLHCMKNRLFDMYRNEKRKLLMDDEEVAKQYAEEGFIDKIIAQENSELMEKEVNRLLQKLPTRHRKIILCRYNYNLKFDEIAEVMDMNADAVKKQLYRSLKLLSQEGRTYAPSYYNTL